MFTHKYLLFAVLHKFLAYRFSLRKIPDFPNHQTLDDFCAVLLLIELLDAGQVELPIHEEQSAMNKQYEVAMQKKLYDLFSVGCMRQSWTNRQKEHLNAVWSRNKDFIGEANIFIFLLVLASEDDATGELVEAAEDLITKGGSPILNFATAESYEPFSWSVLFLFLVCGFARIFNILAEVEDCLFGD